MLLKTHCLTKVLLIRNVFEFGNFLLQKNKIRLYKSKTSLRGSSTFSLIDLRKVTASFPSSNLWSYVSARYIIGRITI